MKKEIKLTAATLKKYVNIINSGYSVTIEPCVKRVDTDHGRDWDVRIIWKAKNGDKLIECEWEGFTSPEEAIIDLTNKIKPKKVKNATNDSSNQQEIEIVWV